VLRIHSHFGFLLLVTVCLNCGCGSSPRTNNPATAATFPAVVFSDVHFNPLDTPAQCQALAAADVSNWAGMLQASSTTLPKWHEDTNYRLFVLALANIKQNLGRSPVAIFAGDLLVHKISTLYYQNCAGLTGQQTPSAQDVANMQAFANKTAIFVMQQVRASLGNIPVMFVVGNNDSYTGLGPDSIFLANTVETYYTNFLNGTPADYPEFFNSFTAGGYYSAEPMGTNLKVISLNTNLFAVPPPIPGLPSNINAAYAELAWLDSTLASAQAAGQKVWLLMHVPPGADTCSTAENLAAGGSLTTANAVMMWVPAYQDSFLQILAKYPGMITLTLGGHTHRDEFRILTSEDVLDIAPSISPYLGNDPAFEVYTFTEGTFIPTDYQSLNYDLPTAPAQFDSYYTFSTTYATQGPLDSSLEQLYPQLLTNSTKQTLYMGQYNSGNNGQYSSGGTPTNWNPVSSTNWPVFACGVGKMAEADFIDCVNAY
jgi:sphingomyelin phosphodiesterase acid-like 3